MQWRDYDPELRRNYNTARWQHVKDDIIERDGGRCQRCGKMITQRFIVHHTTPANLNNFYNEDILQLLCLDCHNYVTFHEGINRNLHKISLFGDAQDLTP